MSFNQETQDQLEKTIELTQEIKDIIEQRIELPLSEESDVNIDEDKLNVDALNEALEQARDTIDVAITENLEVAYATAEALSDND